MVNCRVVTADVATLRCEKLKKSRRVWLYRCSTAAFCRNFILASSCRCRASGGTRLPGSPSRCGVCGDRRVRHANPTGIPSPSAHVMLKRASDRTAWRRFRDSTHWDFVTQQNQGSQLGSTIPAGCSASNGRGLFVRSSSKRRDERHHREICSTTRTGRAKLGCAASLSAHHGYTIASFESVAGHSCVASPTRSDPNRFPLGRETKCQHRQRPSPATRGGT